MAKQMPTEERLAHSKPGGVPAGARVRTPAALPVPARRSASASRRAASAVCRSESARMASRRPVLSEKSAAQVHAATQRLRGGDGVRNALRTASSARLTAPPSAGSVLRRIERGCKARTVDRARGNAHAHHKLDAMHV